MARTSRAFAHEKLTVTTAAKVLSAATYKPTNGTFLTGALITCEDNGIRYTLNGTTPSATVGHILASGGSLQLESEEEIMRFQAYRSASADAVLMVTYSKLDI